MSDVTAIPLRSYRLSPRKPWLRIEGDLLVLRAPTWFAGKTMSVPLATTGVVGPDAVLPDASLDDVLYTQPILIPYVFTTGPAALPNICLLFAEPTALPDLRWAAVPQLSQRVPKRAVARGPARRYVDGVMLRAVDPARAVETLVAAGAERVTAPHLWLDARRKPAASTEADMATLLEKDRGLVRTGRVGLGVMGAGLAGAGALAASVSGDAAVPALLVAFAGLAWHVGCTVRAERMWFKRRGVPRHGRRGDDRSW